MGYGYGQGHNTFSVHNRAQYDQHQTQVVPRKRWKNAISMEKLYDGIIKIFHNIYRIRRMEAPIWINSVNEYGSNAIFT